MRRPFYFFGRAVRNLRGAPLPAIVTAGTIAVSVFLFGAFLLLAGNLARLVAGEIGGDAALTVWVTRGADPRTVRDGLKDLPGIGAIEVVSPTEGLAELAAALGESADLLEGIDPNEVLLAVLVAELAPVARKPAAVRDLAARIRRFDGVSSVDSGLLWLERFAALRGIALGAGVAWGSLLGLGSLLVVGNAARLAALTRRGEIQVLHLVGASDRFIVLPFFWEGMVQGAVGSVLGLGLLYGAFSAIEYSLASGVLAFAGVVELSFLGRETIGSIAGAGPLTGAVGSVGAALRYVRAVRL